MACLAAGEPLHYSHVLYFNYDRVWVFLSLIYVHRTGPIPLAAFAGEETSFAGLAFIKSYIGVCMKGVIIVLACLIFTAFASGGELVIDTSLSAVSMSWNYIAESIFNMLVLLSLVKGADRIAKEMFGV